MLRNIKMLVLLSFLSLSFLIFTFYAPLSESGTVKPKRIYVDMVADMFHYGHAEFLKKAKAEGDYLIVGIISDEDVEGYKRRPIMTLDERATAVANYPLVDEVIPASPLVLNEKFLKDHHIDLVIHGDDMPQEQIDIYYHVPIKMGIFKTVPYTRGISTTELIKRIKSRDDLQRKDKKFYRQENT
ncbi:MAG: adenylyltransferase/cytidyltransferase family protein [Chlamydiia bacterium]|nr:adenylyltransferase/cytidyltransferase family protein [Chlamydiia bacterium]